MVLDADTAAALTADPDGEQEAFDLDDAPDPVDEFIDRHLHRELGDQHTDQSARDQVMDDGADGCGLDPDDEPADGTTGTPDASSDESGAGALRDHNEHDAGEPHPSDDVGAEEHAGCCQDRPAHGGPHCQLSTGARVAVTFAAVLLCTGWVRRLTRDPITGNIVDLGRRQRLFSRAQRRALVYRDRGCVFPGCDRGPSGAMPITSSPGTRAASPT